MVKIIIKNVINIMVIKNYTIYGERCSGTNYVEDLISLNFNIDITWDYGWKHFFGFQDEALQNSDNTLFICIVRDIYTWLNSLYRIKHHLNILLEPELNEDQIKHKYLNEEIWSYLYNSDNIVEEINIDRNIYTKNRYKNIYELRHTKLKFLIEDLPKKVKNYIFIKYEDLINNFENTMNLIKNTGLIVKDNINFPINSNLYKKFPGTDSKEIMKSAINNLTKEEVYNNNNLINYYEEQLGYIIKEYPVEMADNLPIIISAVGVSELLYLAKKPF